MEVFLNYSIDCELPPDGQFGGPATWDVSEASVRGIFPASHNTSLFADTTTHQHRYLVTTCRLARELTEAPGHELVPSPFLAVKEEADRAGAFWARLVWMDVLR